MSSLSLYLEKVYILEGLILSVALYFSIKSSAQRLLLTRVDTLCLETDYYVIGAKFELTNVTIGSPFDLW